MDQSGGQVLMGDTKQLFNKNIEIKPIRAISKPDKEHELTEDEKKEIKKRLEEFKREYGDEE